VSIATPHTTRPGAQFPDDPRITDYLRTQRIIGPDETTRDMVGRIVGVLAAAERDLTGPRTAARFAAGLGTALDQRKIVFSTPIMTNAGRHPDRPLAACAVPPVDLRGDLAHVKQVVDSYHQAGMGTGFNLDDLDDPVKVLRYLNDVAVAGADSGAEDRPVGNMALLALAHPQAGEFIGCKVGADARGERWKFNISLTVTDDEMRAAATGTGRPAELLRAAAEAAHACADPGLVFADRMAAGNPTPHIGPLVSTAPCAEVGLAAGETCQFGYLNLAAFHQPNGSTVPVDLDALAATTRTLVRALDNAIEASLSRYPHATSARIMRAKRKIGVGICGLADLLLAAGIPYGSAQGRRLAQEVIGYVNYISKRASVELARERGACLALLGQQSRYADPGFLGRFATLDLTTAPPDLWKRLARSVADTGLLRNTSTVALPPTGRSSPVIEASTGIEPLFRLTTPLGRPHPAVLAALSNYPDVQDHVARTGHLSEGHPLPGDLRTLLATATQIPAGEHLAMAAAVQACVDEAVSKTVNLPATASVGEVHDIFLNAWEAGCKGATVYRDTSRTLQPKAL
jgi:ribonucleoside-diphosphate reductase alpha chain